MKAINLLVGVLVWSSFASLPIAAVRADGPAVHMPFSGLAVSPESHVRLTEKNQADFEFGTANLLDITEVVHHFTLRNEGSTPIKVTQLAPTCHCTSVELEKIAGKSSDLSDGSIPALLPGQEMTIKVTVQLLGHPAGPLSKGILVYAKGYDEPIARLHATGVIQPAITMTPDVLDFSMLKTGETGSQIITVVYDNRLAPNGNFPALISDNKNIKVEVEPNAASESPKQTPNHDRKTYRVTLQAAPEGILAARLSFALASASQYKGTIPYEQVAATFSSAVIGVRAQIKVK